MAPSESMKKNEKRAFFADRKNLSNLAMPFRALMMGTSTSTRGFALPPQNRNTWYRYDSVLRLWCTARVVTLTLTSYLTGRYSVLFPSHNRCWRP